MSRLGKFFRKGGLRRILSVVPVVAQIIGGPVGRIAGPVMRVVRLLLPKPKSMVHGPTLKEINLKPKVTRRKRTMGTKKWYTSKTYGVVAATILGGIFTMLSPELQEIVKEYTGQIITVGGIIFGILRKMTKQPIE